MRIFILEDDEARIAAFEVALIDDHELTIRRWLSGKGGAYEAFKPPYDLILLDHDLGGRQYVDSNEEETGFQFARWMGAAPVGDRPKSVAIHSYNMDGARAMYNVLLEAGWCVIRQPFGRDLLLWLANLDHETLNLCV